MGKLAAISRYIFPKLELLSAFAWLVFIILAEAIFFMGGRIPDPKYQQITFNLIPYIIIAGVGSFLLLGIFAVLKTISKSANAHPLFLTTKRLIISGVFMIALGLGFLLYIAISSQSGYPTAPPMQQNNQLSEDKLFSLVNEYRKSLGLQILSKDAQICGYARKRSIEIKNNWSHEGFQSDSKKNVLYAQACPNCSHLGENLAKDIKIEEFILEAWKKSPTHNDNLIEPDYNIGCIQINENNYVALEMGQKTNGATNPSNNNVDCTGPDGVHFTTSAEECIAFNAAWGVKVEISK